MDFLTGLRTRAAGRKKTIVLPEGEEPRVVAAARLAADSGVATPVLLGRASRIAEAAAGAGVTLAGIRTEDPADSPSARMFAAAYLELRGGKDVLSPEEARRVSSRPLEHAALMVRHGLADGTVGGAVHTTSDVLRAAIRIIGLEEGVRLVSSCFLMVHPDPRWGEDGVLVYSDAGVNPNPDPEQLADIAILAARFWSRFLRLPPRVALLSFSTKGSGGDHPDVVKVRRAGEIARARAPELAIEDELQADAALVAAIGDRKAPGSRVAGRANVLVFPDLDAGNIAYKLTERLAGVQAIGPLLVGLAKPAHDLSRGCAPMDIVNAMTVAAIQA
ncbi:MAG: phosphotransacetylase [Deltaproteobacteria bacterium]|nr:MAG: phosphotransacetylase [Deltaproteobacteria bacterium]